MWCYFLTAIYWQSWWNHALLHAAVYIGIIMALKNILSNVLQKFKDRKLSKNVEISLSSKPQIEADGIDYGYIFAFWMIWIFVIYLWFLAYSSLSTLYLIFAALVISIAMEKSILRFMQKLKSRILSSVVAYILLTTFLLGWITIIIPFVGTHTWDAIRIANGRIQEFQKITQSWWLVWVLNQYRVPKPLQNIILTSVDWWIWNTVSDAITNNISTVLSTSSKYVWDAWSLAVNIVSTAFNWLFQIFFVLTLAVLFSIEKSSIVWLISRFGGKYEPILHFKLEKAYAQLWAWLKSQLILCWFIWLGSLIWLSALRIFWIQIDSILSLALIAGLMEFIPYLWPILWSIPALIVWWLTWWRVWFLWVAIVFAIIQRMENNVLIPRLMSKTLWVSPLLVFICVVLWGTTLWFVWVVLWVPIAVIITILVEE